MIFRTFTFDIMSSRLEEQIAELIRRTSIGFTRFFKSRLRQTPFVFLVHSREDMDRIWRKKTKNWMTGFANNGNIFLLHPDKYKTESCYKDAGMEHFEKVVKHELCHLYASPFIDRSYPRWFSEGLACYMAGQEKGLLSPKDMLYIFSIVQPSISEYVMGYNWIKFLADKFGKRKLSTFIRSLRGEKYSKKRFNELFMAAYGFNFRREEFEKLF